MLLFWFIATLLVALTLGMLLWPLLRARHVAVAPDDDTAAIAVYRDQKRALDSECAAGAITTSERDTTLAELARRISEDVAAPVPSSASSLASAASAAPPAPRRAWALAVAILLLVPAASFTLYQRLGNPDAAIAATATGSGTGHEVSERQIAARMQEINQYTAAVAASVEQQNSATGEISHNVASAAQGTGHVVAVLGEVAGAATETRASAEVVRNASQTVEQAVGNLRLEVEDFLAKVAV